MPLALDILTLFPGWFGWLEEERHVRNALDTGALQLAKIVGDFSRPMADGSPDLVVTEGAINARGTVDPARVNALLAEPRVDHQRAVCAYAWRGEQFHGVSGQF